MTVNSHEILRRASVRSLEIGNTLEHSGISVSNKLDIVNKECQEENLAEHARETRRCTYRNLIGLFLTQILMTPHLTSN